MGAIVTIVPKTNMETDTVPFGRTVVFVGPFLGCHVSFRGCIVYRFGV